MQTAFMRIAYNGIAVAELLAAVYSAPPMQAQASQLHAHHEAFSDDDWTDIASMDVVSEGDTEQWVQLPAVVFTVSESTPEQLAGPEELYDDAEAAQRDPAGLIDLRLPLVPRACRQEQQQVGVVEAEHAMTESVNASEGVEVVVQKFVSKKAFLRAARTGTHAKVLKLLEAGADPNWQKSGRYTALSVAARNNHANVVRALLAHGADVDLRPRPESPTPLLRAVYMGHTAVVAELLTAGADPHALDYRGIAALHWAAYKGYNDIVQQLVQAGVDVQLFTGYDENSPLMLAARKGYIDVMVTLLNAGADLEAESRNGYTALSNAVYTGQHDAVTLLLQCGAQVDHAFDNGKTALIEAAKRGDVPILTLLLEAGADPAHKNRAGTTALMAAAAKEHQAGVRRLLSASTPASAMKKGVDKVLVQAARHGLAFMVDYLAPCAEARAIESCLLAHHTPIRDQA